MGSHVALVSFSLCRQLVRSTIDDGRAPSSSKSFCGFIESFLLSLRSGS